MQTFFSLKFFLIRFWYIAVGEDFSPSPPANFLVAYDISRIFIIKFVILLQKVHIFLSVPYPGSWNFNYVLLSDLKLVKNNTGGILKGQKL